MGGHPGGVQRWFANSFKKRWQKVFLGSRLEGSPDPAFWQRCRTVYVFMSILEVLEVLEVQISAWCCCGLPAGCSPFAAASAVEHDLLIESI